jgi:hypothetical protein
MTLFFCDWSTAVSTCEGAAIGIYDDWYLPDIDELTEVYTKLHDNGLGDFSDIWYWSSTEAGGGVAAYALWFSTGQSSMYIKTNDFYIIAVRSFMGDPWSTGTSEAETTEPEDVWVRDREMTCYQVWINEGNNFEFVFWWAYKNNNWVQIYDMPGNLVWEIDFSKDKSRFEVELPDGIYIVKTFREYGQILQEFVIGKP